jgi:hypothetical protein
VLQWIRLAGDVIYTPDPGTCCKVLVIWWSCCVQLAGDLVELLQWIQGTGDVITWIRGRVTSTDAKNALYGRNTFLHKKI